MKNYSNTLSFPRNILYWASGLALIVGLVLSIISFLHVCAEECSATELWRYWGFHFQTIGLIFFPILILAHFFSRYNKTLRFISSMMIAGATGSEVMFILVQKFQIGHWCPVCLGIATTIFIAAILYAIDYFFQLNESIEQGRKGDIMKNIWKGISAFVVITLGFTVAFFGVAKEDGVKQAENSIKDQIAFGNKDSKVEVFIFTDWQCPACRGMEPTFVRLAPEIEKKAKLTFADIDVHPETLNFIPYNLSFMVHNKDKYLELRDALTQLSTETKEPTDDQVKKAIKPLGVKYAPLHYADVAIGIKYFKHLEEQFDLESTPTVVIVNQTDKKGKKFVGKEITRENVMETIDMMSQQ